MNEEMRMKSYRNDDESSLLTLFCYFLCFFFA
jgi:hypothetical protein